MVIFQIHVVGVASLKAEGHPPVSPYGHCPHAFAVALERMQPKRGLLHIPYAAGLVQRRKDQPQTVNLIGFNLAGIVLFEQAPQALMAKALDHRPTVKRQLTFVNAEGLGHVTPSLFPVASGGSAARAAHAIRHTMGHAQSGAGGLRRSLALLSNCRNGKRNPALLRRGKAWRVPVSIATNLARMSGAKMALDPKDDTSCARSLLDLE